MDPIIKKIFADVEKYYQVSHKEFMSGTSPNPLTKEARKAAIYLCYLYERSPYKVGMCFKIGRGAVLSVVKEIVDSGLSKTYIKRFGGFLNHQTHYHNRPTVAKQVRDAFRSRP